MVGMFFLVQDTSDSGMAHKAQAWVMLAMVPLTIIYQLYLRRAAGPEQGYTDVHATRRHRSEYPKGTGRAPVWATT
jgi:hypothetical protein